MAEAAYSKKFPASSSLRLRHGPERNYSARNDQQTEVLEFSVCRNLLPVCYWLDLSPSFILHFLDK
jgi:hypothetical protein